MKADRRNLVATHMLTTPAFAPAQKNIPAARLSQNLRVARLNGSYGWWQSYSGIGLKSHPEYGSLVGLYFSKPLSVATFGPSPRCKLPLRMAANTPPEEAGKELQHGVDDMQELLQHCGLIARCQTANATSLSFLLWELQPFPGNTQALTIPRLQASLQGSAGA